MNTTPQGQSNAFFQLKIEELIDNTETLFDAYTSIGGEMLLYAKAPYRWTKREITELLKMGIENLYVTNSQKNTYQRYLTLCKPAPQIDESLAPRFRIQQIQDVGAHLMEVCFLTDLSADLMNQMQKTSSQIVSCLKEQPSSVKYLKTLVEHDLYTYIHSVGVGCLSTAMAIHLGETDERTLEKFALGGLLHDVGKKKVPLQILNKSGPLTPGEWDIMKDHPQMGFSLLSEQGALEQDVLQMVALHHEKRDGSGYPNGLHHTGIPEEVQLVTVADIFNALTTSRCYHSKRTRFEALMFMKHNLKGKILPDALKALVMVLADQEKSDPSAHEAAMVTKRAS